MRKSEKELLTEKVDAELVAQAELERSAVSDFQALLSDKNATASQIVAAWKRLDWAVNTSVSLQRKKASVSELSD